MNILDDESSKDKYSISDHLKYIKDSILWMKFVGITVKIICGISFLSITFQLVKFAPGNLKIVSLLPNLLLLTLICFIYYIFDLVQKSSEYFEKYFRTLDEGALRKGLDFQQKYWRAAGYLSVIYLAIVILLFFAGFLFRIMNT